MKTESTTRVLGDWLYRWIGFHKPPTPKAMCRLLFVVVLMGLVAWFAIWFWLALNTEARVVLVLVASVPFMRWLLSEDQ